MSTDRLPDYKGRHWAYKEDDMGIIVSVHHFSSEEVRDGWVSMDPEVRFVASEKHPSVKRWLRADQAAETRRGLKKIVHDILKTFRIIG